MNRRGLLKLLVAAPAGLVAAVALPKRAAVALPKRAAVKAPDRMREKIARHSLSYGAGTDEFVGAYSRNAARLLAERVDRTILKGLT